MKERILAALKAKFQGVNANILDRIAEMLAKTVTTEEQVTTAVEGVTKEFIDVIEAYGDSRATDAQKSAVQNYEKKYGLKDGMKLGGKEDKTTETTTSQHAEATEDTPAWAKALIKSNEEMKERLDRYEGERTSASRRKVLDGIIERLPESQRKGYQRISVENLSDEEFNTLKGEVESEVEALVKESGAKSAVFGRPIGSASRQRTETGQKAEATDAEASAVVDKLNI